MTSARNSPESTSVVVAKYEALRGAALGAVLPPEARGGLMLFLRRGMWGWARVAASPASMSIPELPTRSSSRLTSRSPHEREAIVNLFAAIAMNPDNRGAS
jgi:hypothetical protein